MDGEKLAEIFRSASDEILMLICEAMGSVTQDDDYVSVFIASNDFKAKADAIMRRARELGNAEIERMFEDMTKELESGVAEFFDYRGIEQVETAAKSALVANGVKRAKKSLDRLTSVTGIRIGDKVTTMRSAYVEAVSRAVTATNIGTDTFTAVVKKTVNQLQASGVKSAAVAEFASGRTQEVYSVVRRDVMAAFSDTVYQYNQELGNEFGADGWEVSAHVLCAQDHLEFQGKQYTKDEMDDIQSSLDRKLVEGPNCNHALRPIVMGISKPAYSREALDEMRRKSEEIIAVPMESGKVRNMSRYDASQYMRSLETRARRYATRSKLEKATGLDGKASDKLAMAARKAAREVAAKADLTYRYDRTRAN